MCTREGIFAIPARRLSDVVIRNSIYTVKITFSKMTENAWKFCHAFSVLQFILKDIFFFCVGRYYD